MVDIRREGRSQKSASQNRHKAHQTGAPGNLGWVCGGATARYTRGERACQAPGCLSCSDRGRHKTQAQPSMRLCGAPENLNLSSLGLGSARNPGPTPWSGSHSLEPEQCRWGKHTRPPRAGANPVWPEHCECSPHTPVTFVCSAPPSPQHDWTSEPKQETTFARLCQGGN